MAESLQSLKIRQKGVHNINQITKAMELVAATKMRKSQEIALASRPYAFAALDLLSNLSRLSDVKLPPILQSRDAVRTAYVVVTSDKGLAGSFNNGLLRAFEQYATREHIDFESENNIFIAVGLKATQFLEKKTKKNITKFIRIGDYATVAQIQPIADTLTSGYLEGTWDRVIVFSTNFRSALQQDVLMRQILPVTFENLKKTAGELIPETGRFAELVKQHEIPLFASPKLSSEGGFAYKTTKEYIIEPSPEEALTALASHLVLMEIYHLILEANASEHAARRMAMKNASDNAKELSTALSLQYNKSRQASITREIIEVSAGAEALA